MEHSNISGPSSIHEFLSILLNFLPNRCCLASDLVTKSNDNSELHTKKPLSKRLAHAQNDCGLICNVPLFCGS